MEQTLSEQLTEQATNITNTQQHLLDMLEDMPVQQISFTFPETTVTIKPLIRDLRKQYTDAIRTIAILIQLILYQCKQMAYLIIVPIQILLAMSLTEISICPIQRIKDYR
jgi:CRISPR/Cas system type I-B associated protein Csh2 (Cas7 group RAMP superfamily)